MSWKFCVFKPTTDAFLKHHWFPEELEQVVLEDVEKRHHTEPYRLNNKDCFKIDPGGMISLVAVPFTKTFGELEVSINPEHIYHAILCWELTRDMDNDLVKIYFHNECVVLSKQLHSEIGSWLASISSDGIKARFDLAEKLQDKIEIDLPVINPKEIGEA